ncbi:MAG: hypothetical protein KGD63_01330 [Candidatus Lokiarchaeota archaeon]|nr:hypothetical protein [Candidatus Lokiarchaeota archaeon]
MDNYKNSKETEPKENNLRFNSMYSNQLDNIIKNLTKPSFLGSIHLENQTDNNITQIENFIKTDYQLRLNKSIKNSIFNPLTKILIFIIIVFNVLWFSSKFYS